jgi:hypothetical protein
MEEKEIRNIQSQVEQVLQYSQNIDKLDLTNLIDRWYESKQFFIEAFGDKCIYESPHKITFHMSEENKKAKLDNFIATLYPVDLYPLSRYLMTRSTDEFFSNTVLQEYEYDGEIIPKGMKLLRSFKYFISDADRLFQIQQLASAIIAEDKVEGYPCISVHPLDYLSASENNYNWRSCHALDGEYKAGNLSYMCDKSTIVCYIKGDDDNVILPRFPESVPWNSKKWRMFFFLADEHNALYAGRQYPFTLDEVMYIFRDMLFEKLEYHPYHWSDWHNDKLDRYQYKDASNEYMEFTHYQPQVPIGGKFYGEHDLITDVEGSRHFNDLLYSSFYIPYYSWRHTSRYPIHFTLGSKVKCICCDTEEPVHGQMVCYSCGQKHHILKNYRVCNCCGEEIEEEAGYWIRGGTTFVCEDCFNSETSSCESCGEVYYSSELVYDEEEDRWLCPHCARFR